MPNPHRSCSIRPVQSPTRYHMTRKHTIVCPRDSYSLGRNLSAEKEVRTMSKFAVKALLCRQLVCGLAIVLGGCGSGSSSWDAQRERMVAEQIEGRGIRNSRVLAVMRQVPRHLFVPDAHRDEAYQDRPLPIGEGQTISQPY